MVLAGGRERTAAEYQALLEAAGFVMLARRLPWAAACAGGLLAYFLLLSGPVATPKYRMPMEPVLIVLSTIIPKTNSGDMIRAIRQREHLGTTPILLTVSGYTGSSPKQDAVRLGATDILPKPYSEGDFLSKVHQMLGRVQGQLTSDQIFGDVLAESVVQGGAKKAMSTKDDVDKLVADTLSGVMKKKESTPVPKPKTQPGSAELDKLIADLTLTSRPKTSPGGVPHPAPPTLSHEDNVAISQPVFTEAPVAAR